MDAPAEGNGRGSGDRAGPKEKMGWIGVSGMGVWSWDYVPLIYELIALCPMVSLSFSFLSIPPSPLGKMKS